MKKPVLVVGAGLSGLSAAWYLANRGAAVRGVCADADPGGLIHTRRMDEGLVETAANSLVVTARARALCAAIGVELCEPQKDSKRRFVFRDLRPRRWPLTMTESLGGAASVAWALARRAAKPRDGETVSVWGHRVIGRAMTDRLIAPVLQGIYAAPADRLSARAVFGSRKGRKGGVGAPRSGMGEIIERLADRLKDKGVSIECGVRVAALTSGEPAVVCTAAPEAARLLAPHAPELARAVSAIELSSAISVTAFFEPRPDDLRGFGVLFPRGAGVDALGVLFNSDIFPGRSALRSETWILAGAGRQHETDEAILADHVLPDRQLLSGRTDRPVAAYVTRWAQAIPIYDDAVLAAGALVGTLPPWLSVAGNYLGRIGASSLFDVAAEAADRLAL